ncbi:MAG: hypothetical protein IJ736_06115 [Firmicutes bacterium]|nr:hypothetical protein [Bacillota bacterium]
MMNPILRKEMKTSFRKHKIFTGTAIYVFAIMSLAAMIIIPGSILANDSSAPTVSMVAYGLVSALQLFLVYVIVPAISGSAISGERERQTLDTLLMTKMTGKDIVKGKLMSSLMVVGLMLFAAMPVYGVIFYYGGIDIIGFIMTMVFIMAHAFYVGNIALYLSAKMKKSIVATITTYAMIIGINFALNMITGIGSVLMSAIALRTINNGANQAVDMSTQIAGSAMGLIGYLSQCMGTSTSFMSLVSSVTDVEEVNFMSLMFTQGMSNGGVVDKLVDLIPLWLFNICFVVAMGMAFQMMTSAILSPKKKRKIKKGVMQQ